MKEEHVEFEQSVDQILKGVVIGVEPVQWWEKNNRVLYHDASLLKLEKMPNKVLAFSCTQSPLQHLDFINFLSRVIQQEQPDMIVCLGDLVDMTFGKPEYGSPDDLSPSEEVHKAKEWCQELFKVVPQAIMLTSNHAEDRMATMKKRGNIPSAFVRRWQEVFEVPEAWKTLDYLTMGRFLFEHAHGVGKGAKTSIREETIRRFNQAYTVVRAHRHTLAGPVAPYEWESQTFLRSIIYVGAGMDEKQVGYSRAGLWNTVMVFDRGACIPFPMEKKPDGRWSGRLVNGLLGE